VLVSIAGACFARRAPALGDSFTGDGVVVAVGLRRLRTRPRRLRADRGALSVRITSVAGTRGSAMQDN